MSKTQRRAISKLLLSPVALVELGGCLCELQHLQNEVLLKLEDGDHKDLSNPLTRVFLDGPEGVFLITNEVHTDTDSSGDMWFENRQGEGRRHTTSCDLTERKLFSYVQ